MFLFCQVFIRVLVKKCQEEFDNRAKATAGYLITLCIACFVHAFIHGYLHSSLICCVNVHELHCKSFEVEKFHGFHRSTSNRSETVCTIGFSHTRLPSNCERCPANYSLVLQPQNFSTLNDLQYRKIQKKYRKIFKFTHLSFPIK